MATEEAEEEGEEEEPEGGEEETEGGEEGEAEEESGPNILTAVTLGVVTGPRELQVAGVQDSEVARPGHGGFHARAISELGSANPSGRRWWRRPR